MAQTEEIADTTGVSERSATRGWLGVAAVASATFTVVTSEMLPVGLLTPIGDALKVTEGTAGLTLTITGLVGAVSAPLLTPLLGRFDRRAVLCALMAVLTVGNLLAAWTPNFAVMVAARVLVGIGMGGVWAIAAGLAVRLVPPKSIGSATSLIFSGIAVASVLGVPRVRTSANWPTGGRRSSPWARWRWWSWSPWRCCCRGCRPSRRCGSAA